MRKRRNFVCEFQGCEKQAKSKGLCGSHYSQLRRARGLKPVKPHVLSGRQYETCTVDGCARKHWARGYCGTHYAQMHRGRTIGLIGPRRDLGEQVRATCGVHGCPKRHRRNGFCSYHSWIDRIYGLNPADIDQMLSDQGGVCAICHSECATYKNLSIDHDHETGDIRGLLCSRCNVGLGKFRENASLLRSAADYLDQCHINNPARDIKSESEEAA